MKPLNSDAIETAMFPDGAKLQFTAEASDLGLSPGEWPDKMTVPFDCSALYERVAMSRRCVVYNGRSAVGMFYNGYSRRTAGVVELTVYNT